MQVQASATGSRTGAETGIRLRWFRFLRNTHGIPLKEERESRGLERLAPSAGCLVSHPLARGGRDALADHNQGVRELLQAWVPERQL
ncbi:hypothetical protein MGN01_45700 [Methylobacterium gnaphalii]|uniref:Uncharacterized protein n=1 Tax=Methylobacterium gnaphalii TaxID=1010610 RepID=A0A512JS01_9HYPH|nr:hypothetical protein MGN01_45700 [Methylobacterium gnaphalii]GLS48489.1 hypothetical protein GCM10007885_13330 [Methylobacterium gnaphalii]